MYPSLKRHRGILIALAGAAALLVLTACGPTAPAPETPGAGSEHPQAQAAVDRITELSQPTEDYETPGDPTAGESAEGKTIYFVPIGLKVAYFLNIEASMKLAVAALGAELVTCDGGFTPAGVSACLDQAANSGADAVVTGAVPYEMASNSFDALAAKDIPVYLATARVPDGVSPLLVSGPTDELLPPVAALAADAVIADSNAQANVLYIKVIDSPALTAMGDAGVAQLREECDACEITVKDYSSANQAQLASLVSAELLAGPDIDYVISQTDAQLADILKGIQTAGRAGQVKVASANGSLSALQMVGSGQLLADVGYSAAYLGWTYVDAVVRLLNDETVPEYYPSVIRVFTEDNIGDLELTPEAEASVDWYGSDAYQDMFSELWGV